MRRRGSGDGEVGAWNGGDAGEGSRQAGVWGSGK